MASRARPSSVSAPVDFENDLLVVTCASGKQCSFLVPLLYGKWKRLRLAVNSSSSEQRLQQQYPDAEVVRVDLADPKAGRQLLKGAASVYHIGPSYHPYEVEISYYMIDAAMNEREAAGLKHFVFSSVLNPQIRKMLNHDAKRYVEERLIESELHYTVLRPSHFMDNMPFDYLASQDKPVHNANWDPTVPFSFTALKDFGEASAKVLKERSKHCLAQYDLVSTRSIPYTEVIAGIGKELGKHIAIEQVSYEDAVEFIVNRLFGTRDKTNVDPRLLDCAERMLLFYNRRGLTGNPNVLEWLLGRKPTSHSEWIRRRLRR